MTNEQLREEFENQNLHYKIVDQIRKDINHTARSQGIDEESEEYDGFLNDFWNNYCPEDDGNSWVRDDKKFI